MKTWFAEYTKDGIVTYHILFDATDRESALEVLRKTFGVTLEQVLDLHETTY